MASEVATASLSDVLRDGSRPAFLFGSVPPREGTTVEDAKETCKKFAARSAVLATDGFIVYDIQDERGRTNLERPFPFRKTMDPSEYASFFPAASGKQCVVYKSVVESGEKGFLDWIDNACDKYKHNAFNLVGAATSSVEYGGLKLPEAGEVLRRRGGCAFGCVAIPERHTSKGNENSNMLKKMQFGAEWFITQGVFAAAPIIKLLNDYGDLCREKGLVPKKVILTFAPCGRPKTMTFIKWLGMHVPEEIEKRIFDAAVPVKESVAICRELLLQILQGTSSSGVPLGVNVESLSIFKDEIDAAHDLFQILQATLLNNRGSPWAVRWFPVAEWRVYTPAKASSSALNLLALAESDSNAHRENRLTKTTTTSASTVAAAATPSSSSSSAITPVDEDTEDMKFLLTVAFAGILGVVIGRYSRSW